MSADRAGVLACGTVDHAISTAAKLTLGVKEAKLFRLALLERQAQELSRGSRRIAGRMFL